MPGHDLVPPVPIGPRGGDDRPLGPSPPLPPTAPRVPEPTAPPPEIAGLFRDASAGPPPPPGAPPGPDERLFRRVLAPYRALSRYCRVAVEGLDRVPRGPVLVVGNHTGWTGLDYGNLAVALHRGLGRLARGVVHPLWFRYRPVAGFARRLGLVPASRTGMVDLLRRRELVAVFPEGVAGSFRRSDPARRYRLAEFKRGFVRAAMATGAPIVPVAIVGGEEANPCLGTLRFTERRVGMPMPLPLNFFPLPVKWRISFLPPIPMAGYTEADAADRPLVVSLAERVRAQIASELDVQQRKRGSPYW